MNSLTHVMQKHWVDLTTLRNNYKPHSPKLIAKHIYINETQNEETFLSHLKEVVKDYKSLILEFWDS